MRSMRPVFCGAGLPRLKNLMRWLSRDERNWDGRDTGETRANAELRYSCLATQKNKAGEVVFRVVASVDNPEMAGGVELWSARMDPRVIGCRLPLRYELLHAHISCACGRPRGELARQFHQKAYSRHPCTSIPQLGP